MKMDVEEKVFGPLSFKQFIYTAIGFGLGYLAYNNLDFKISIVIIVVLIGGFIAMILNSPKIEINEDYLKAKQSNSKTPDEFKRWLMMKFDLLQSQVEMRKQKGIINDPKLDEALKLFGDWLNKNE